MGNPKEQVKAAFGFEESGTVPYHVWMHPDTRTRMDEHLGDTGWYSDFTQYIYNTKFFGFPNKPEGEGTYRDAYGTLWQDGAYNTARHMLEPALPEPSLEGYEWPSPAGDIRWDAIRAEWDAHDTSYRMSGLGSGLFERAWMLRGMEDLMMEMVTQPEFVHELLDRILDVHLEAIDAAAQRLSLDGYFTGDDWSGQTGLLMSPDSWRTFIKPRLSRMVDRCHANGLPIIFHSCGNYIAILDDLLEIGIDGLESLQPEALDLAELKRRTAGRVFLVGGIGVQSTLFTGTPEEVRSVTRGLLTEMGSGGGYVISPSKPLHEQDLPIGNIAAFLDTIMHQ